MKPSERRRLQNLAESRRAEEERLQKLLEEEDEQPGQQQVVLNETARQATTTEAVFSPSSKSVRLNDTSSLPSRQKANPLSSPSSSSSTKKRTRLSESSGLSSSGRKAIDPKWLDTQNPLSPKKSIAKSRGRLTVSLDLSSDEDEEPPLLSESKTFKRPPDWKRTNGSGKSPRKAPLSRPLPVSQLDSDSEDSFTRNMDTLSRKKNKTSSLSSSMTVTSPPEASSTFKKRKSLHRAKPRGTSLSSDDDNDDIIEHVTSHQEDEVENSSDEDQESTSVGSHGRKSHAAAKRCTVSTKRRRSLSSSSSSSQDDGEKSARVAHNPIALERLEKEKIKTASNKGAHPEASGQPQHDDLWEDPPEADGSEEEKQVSTKRSKQTKRPSSRRSSGSSFPSQSNTMTVGGTSAWYSNVLDIRGHWLHECDHDEDKLANLLHPDGSGRVADDSNQINDPLVLVNGEERYKVPASLTRYFFDYQRTGIEFMFDCLIHNRGCM